jgi:tRNA-dihydrouridine synthase B
MNIGNIEITNPIFLAPMAGVTDYPFRILCKEMGAGVVYSEFVSADGIIRENTKTLNLIHFEEIERPIGIQIFGSDPEIMSKAAIYVCKAFKPDILDINYGCPVPKVTKRGGGSAALKDLCLMDDITQAVVESVPNVPVTVKMRMGWDHEKIIIPEVGPRLERLGVKAITLHPRTTKQRYSGKADWEYIRDLKNSCKIPIIGNGDVQNSRDVLEMFEHTGCDAVMVGRGAYGNPWFFKEALATLKGQPPPPPPSLVDIAITSDRHFKLLVKSRGEQAGTNLMRRHFSNYIKGFNGASALRQKLVTALDMSKMRIELDNFKKQAEEIENK